jgi:hypothetical protein
MYTARLAGFAFPPIASMTHNILNTEPKLDSNSYFLKKIDKKIKKESPQLRQNIFTPDTGERWGVRRNIAQLAVSSEFMDDKALAKYVPKDKQKLVKGVVKSLQEIDKQTGLGHEAATGVANAAIGAYQLNKQLEKYHKAVNEPQTLEDWNEFKNRVGGKTRKKRCRYRRSRYIRKS